MPKGLWAALLLLQAAAKPFIKIAAPAPDAVVYGVDDGTGANIRGVTLTLHYYDLPDDGYERLRVVTRVDRGYTSTLGPPLPDSTLVLSSRLGTHFLEIVLRERDELDGGFADAATVTYDLVPPPGDAILRDAGNATLPEGVVRPRGDALSHGACLEYRDKPLKVVLAGQLQLGGQSMLALEQARRLPSLRTWSNQPAFELAFAFALSPDPARTTGPLEPLLRDLDVPIHKFVTSIPAHLVQRWGPGNTTSALSQVLAAASTLDELDADVLNIIRPFIDVVRGADVFSFTNHENHRSDDGTMVEAARLAGVPHILCEPSNLWWGSLPTGADGAATLVVPSAFAGRFWKERGASSVVQVVPPGFEAGPYIPEVVNTSRVRFGFVGRLAPQKSPGLFVRAAAAVGKAYEHTPVNVSFAVLGDGPLREPLELLADRLGLRVTGGRYVTERGTGPLMHFMGWLDPSEVRAAIKDELDVIVHSNILEETFCMCNVEAMAEGKAVVTFGVGGVSEYLRPGDAHGVVVHHPSVPGLTTALLQLAEDADLRRRLGSNAAPRVRGLKGGDDLSFDRMATQYANLYAGLVCPARDLNERASDVACALHDGAETADPGALIRKGEYWAAACGVARLNSEDPQMRHLLALLLGEATRVDRENVTPPNNSREREALLVAAAVAAASRLDAALDRRGALTALAAQCLTKARGSPDKAADLWEELFWLRRPVLECNASLWAYAVPDTNARVFMEDGAGGALQMGSTPLKLSNLRPGGPSDFEATPGKLRHAAAQFAHLAAAGVELAERVRRALAPCGVLTLAELAQAYAAAASDLSEVSEDDETDARSLREVASDAILPVLATLDRGVHLFQPRASVEPAVVIDAETARQATAAFERINLCVIDDALSDHALQNLRRQLVESTVWYDAKRGHLGAYLEDGLASSLLLQVVEEFGKALPAIVGPKRLVQAWGYKYHGAEADMGIRPHADEGAVTVNCWLTPDRFNLRNGSGGLRVYNASVPDSMSDSVSCYTSHAIDATPVPARGSPIVLRAGPSCKPIGTSVRSANTWSTRTVWTWTTAKIDASCSGRRWCTRRCPSTSSGPTTPTASTCRSCTACPTGGARTSQSLLSNYYVCYSVPVAYSVHPEAAQLRRRRAVVARDGHLHGRDHRSGPPR